MYLSQIAVRHQNASSAGMFIRSRAAIGAWTMDIGQKGYQQWQWKWWGWEWGEKIPELGNILLWDSTHCTPSKLETVLPEWKRSWGSLVVRNCTQFLYLIAVLIVERKDRGLQALLVKLLVLPQIYIFHIYTGPNFTQIPDLHRNRIYTNPDLHGPIFTQPRFTQIHFRT